MSPAVAKDDALAAMVPAEVAADGKLVDRHRRLLRAQASSSTPTARPSSASTRTSCKAVGQVLGLEAEMQNAPFDSLVEGVKTGKYELGVSSFTINPERQEQVDMPSYFSAGTAVGGRQGQPRPGSPRTTPAARRSRCRRPQCRSMTSPPARRPAPTRARTPSRSSSTSCRATRPRPWSAARTTPCSPTPRWWPTPSSRRATSSRPWATSTTPPRTAYAVPKGQGELTQAIQGALQKLMDDGTYLKVLKNWGVESRGDHEVRGEPSAVGSGAT